MQSPFLLWGLLVFAIGVPIAVIVYGLRVQKNRQEWLKDILVPVMTSLVVALVGLGFAFESGRRQRADLESDRQTSVMRELMVSQDRRDTAYILALNLNLNIHLHRYIRLKQEQSSTRFEEEAIFFFYSKHRAALVNLRSSEGSLVFRRLWMENVFEQLSIHVVESVLGGLSERDPGVSAEGESATYKLFGARVPSATEMNDEPKRLGGHPMVLADFNRLINDETRPLESQDQDTRRIRQEFEAFQKRLHNGDKQPPIDPHINKAELINSLLAMQGLVAYSYQNLFSVWYGLAEEEILADVKQLPQVVPKNFLNLMWYDFERVPPAGFTGDWQTERMKKWKKKREDAWRLILKFCPKEAES